MLPRLEVPTYTLIQPSTKKQIVFRPFLVNEHRQLMMASGVGSIEQFRIVKNLINVCTFEKLNIDKLPNFDIEYIFLNLRARSISEIVKLTVTCECGHQQDHSIDLTTVIVEETASHTNKIMIADDIGIQMRYPTGDEVAAILETPTQENVFRMMNKCIDGVFDQKNYWSMSDQTDEEIDSFISSFTNLQFEKIEQFFSSIPKLRHKIEFKCNSCETINTVMMEGLGSFFA